MNPIASLLAQADTYTFARMVLSLGPKGNKRPGFVSESRKGCDFLDNPYKRKIYIGPRGMGKTTMLRAWVVKKLCQNRNTTFALGASNVRPDSISVQTSRAIKKYLSGAMHGSRVPSIFGAFNLETDRDEVWTLAGRTVPTDTPTWSILSPGKPHTGLHVTVRLFDNLQDSKNTKNIELIESEVIATYADAVPLAGTEDDAQVLVIDNAFHHADLGHRIVGDRWEECLESGEPTLVKGEFGEFLALIQRAYEPASAKLFDVKKLNFPFNLPLTFLEEQSEQMPASLFTAQYLANPVADEEVVFRPEHYKTWDALPTNLQCFVTCDLAYETKRSNDESVFVVWGVSDGNVVYEVDFFGGRVNMDYFCKRMLDSAFANGALRMGVEKGALSVAFRAEVKRQMLERNQFIAIEELDHGNKPKVDRAMGVQGRYNAGGFLFHPNDREMKKQLLDFPRARHDDFVDNVSYVAQVLHWRTKGIQQEKPKEYDPFWDVEGEGEEAAMQRPFYVHPWQERGGFFPDR